MISLLINVFGVVVYSYNEKLIHFEVRIKVMKIWPLLINPDC